MSLLQNMDQAAGNSWIQQTLPMLHETISPDLTRLVTPSSSANSLFDAFEKQMHAGEAEFSNNLKALREKYIFSYVEAVESFIRTHRVIAPLLIEAAPQFASAFGGEAPLTLEIMSDDEPPHSIYALAIWKGDATNARAALRTFDEGWLGRNFEAVGGRVVFDYELI